MTIKFSNKQKTIKDTIYLSGKSLHTGLENNIYLYPAECDTGIKINGLNLNPTYILNTNGMTTHGNINQVEHILSGLYACGIDNINIKINGNEMPILCGGSRIILDEILKVGIVVYDKEKIQFLLDKEIIVKNKDSYVKFTPNNDNNTNFICNVDFPYVGKQNSSWKNTDFDNYYNSISNAKTFFWKEQYEEQLLLNRCKGLEKNINCLIIDEFSNLKNNELANHKLLDLIGDLNTLCLNIPGTFESYKGGHALNIKLAKKINDIYINQQNQNIVMNIPYFKMSDNINNELILNHFKDCLEKNNFVNSDYVTNLEKDISKFIGCKHVLATNSGTSALELSLMSLELEKESYVLVPNLTFWATYEAVKLLGHKPIVIDVDNNFQMDYNLIKKAVKKYNVKAILIVHLYGFISPNLNLIKNFCLKRNIYLVEDGSHAFGSKFNNEYVFKDSFLAGISLYPTKILGSCGNSGIIITNCDNIANKVRIYRDNGRDKFRYIHEKIGTNKIMNSIQAIYLSEKLNSFDSTLYKLQTNYLVYKNELNNLKTFQFKTVKDNLTNGYMSIITTKLNNSLNNILKRFKKIGINCANIYPNTIASQPGFDKNDITILNGTADTFCNNVINLPSYYNLTVNEQKYIIENIKKMDKINIAIIGCGRMGKFHINELLKNDNFNIVGIIDPYISEYKNLKFFTSIKEAREAGADVLLIASNTETHYKIANEALLNNLNLFIEKPAFLSVKDHNTIINLAKTKNLKVAVGMIERYNPVYKNFKINTNTIKKISCIRRCRVPNNGNVNIPLVDLMCHDIDLINNKVLPLKDCKEIKFLKKNGQVICSINGIKIYFEAKYTNDSFCREHIIYTKNDKIILDLNNNEKLLKYEHNDFYNYLLNNKNQICTLEDSKEIIKFINMVSDITKKDESKKLQVNICN